MVDASIRRAFIRRLSSWGRANRRQFGWRGETDPFRVLVAEVLLQRSRARTVDVVYRRLLDRWPTPEAMAGASVAALRSVIRPLGLVGRAQTLKALAGEVVSRGAVPGSTDELLRLPGVGPYAARATAAAAFGAHEPLVDSVTGRVYRRYFGAEPEAGPTVDDELWRLVDEVSPKRRLREWNWAVLDLAAAICLPKRPRCASCPLEDRCAWARRARYRARV
jgi:A/G-specific adenine glycosylase